jgi:hypothetical protein
MRSWLSGWWSFLRPGFNATVIVLVAVGIFTWRYASHVHPDTGTPQPGESGFTLSFARAHHAHSPIKVNVTLAQGQAAPTAEIFLELEVSGPDLTHPGWSLQGQVPSGATSSDGRITRAGSKDNVYYSPGALRPGDFFLSLGYPLAGMPVPGGKSGAVAAR